MVSLKTSARVGRDNEALRSRLADTTSQLSVVENLTASFRELIAPLSSLLRALEEEKSGSVRTKGALGALRVTHDAMIDDFQRLEKRHSEGQAENEQMRQELETVLARIKDLKAEKGQLNSDIAGERSAMAMVERQLDEETSSVRALREENKSLVDPAEALEQKTTALEIQATGARLNLSALENEKAGSRARARSGAGGILAFEPSAYRKREGFVRRPHQIGAGEAPPWRNGSAAYQSGCRLRDGHGADANRNTSPERQS